MIAAAIQEVQLTQQQIDQITQHVAGQLPPVVMEIQDGDKVFRQSKPLGKPIRMRVEGIIKAK